MKFPKINLRNDIKLAILLALAFSAIAFVEKKQDNKKINELNILIHDEGNNYFLNREDVRKLVTADDIDYIIGSGYDEIDLKAIERRVLNNQYVYSTQAFKDLSGNLTIEISLCKPIARIIRKDRMDSYICESGKIIHISEKHTSRVLLISGEYMSQTTSGNIASDSTFSKVFDLIKYINKDPFWNAQIAQININKSGEISLYPQVTKQYIEFGKAENIHKKFLKLKYFYTKILPFKGWNHYARVNVEYEQQIICE
jgi:cell division protein FtsQ